MGLQVKKIEDGILINQDNYIRDLLKRFGMQDSFAGTTPLTIELS